MQVRDIPIGGDRRELTKHGEEAFPLALYRSVLSRNVLGYTDWHWHTELQLCLVTAGAVRFFVYEQECVLGVGEGIFIGSGSLHMARPVADPDSAYLCLDFSPRLLASFPGSVFEQTYVLPFLHDPALECVPLHPETDWERTVLGGIAAVAVLAERADYGWEFAAAAQLGKMWLALTANRPVCAGRMPVSSLPGACAVRAILDYISRHYSEHVTLREIAKAAAFSESECCRLFKKMTGETVFSHLCAYRLARAMELLRETDCPVSAIAYDTGFCSASYFVAQFRRNRGMTPSQYRKSAK